MVHIKLTDKDGKTRAEFHNECQWGDNVTHKATGTDILLCSDGFIHFYSGETLEEAISIALLRDPHDGGYTDGGQQFKAWLCQAEDVVEEPIKCGAKTVTTIREVEVPSVTPEQRAEVAIRVSLLVYDEESYVAWANKWLSGEDRSRASAYAAADAAADAAEAAADAAAEAAADAAADAAACATYAAHAADAAACATYAAHAAAYAAEAAADAADAGVPSKQIKQIAAEVLYRRK